MNTEYRIIKYEDDGEVFYCIEECMVDEDGVMKSHTIEYSPKCTSIKELNDNLDDMKYSFTKPILGSFPPIQKGGGCND